MNNATPHSKMAARAHRKGFKPLPANGWSPEWGPWEAYKERCVREGASVGNNEFGDYITWRDDVGFTHREDGPAHEYKDGLKEWFIIGRRHRLDGPARVRKDGSVEFYKYDIRYTDITFTQRY